MNLTELLDSAAARWPRKSALIDGDTVVTYGALVAKVDLLANELKAMGVSSGHRIGLNFPNSIGYVALTYALWRCGAVVVPLPAECTAEEVALIGEATELAGLVSEKEGGDGWSQGDGFWYRPLAAGARADNHGLNMAFIRFTSGTTNERKGVVLCHESVRDRIVAANKAFCIGPEDTIIWCLPMAHHFLITIVLYLIAGATIVMARHVLARAFLEAVNRWRGTVLYAAPFHYALLARDGSETRMDSVRLAVSTTCALPQRVAEEFRKRFERPISQALGVIELGLVSLNTDDPVKRWNSVGKPLADHEVRVISPDAEGCGEIMIRGPGFFDAYASPWAGRDEVLPGGWFETGDMGRLDEDGFLFLAGRKTAVINLAGRKVFPEEIEEVLNRHPGVRESRVYGRLHPHLGEVVEAEVVLLPGVKAEEVREFCRPHLSAYKIPAELQVVKSLARTAGTGKIRRPVAASQHD